MNLDKPKLKETHLLVLRWLTFILVIMLFAGYSLRGVIPYNFEQILILMFFLGGYVFWKQKKHEVLDRSFNIWLLLLTSYWLSIFLISFYHFSFGEVTVQKLQIVFLILGFIVLGLTILNLNPSIDYFWYFLIVASMFMAIWLGMELKAHGLDAVFNATRFGGAYGHPIKFGVYGNGLLILMLGGFVWAYKKHPLLLILWVLLVISNLLIVILSQSRTAWIGWPEAIIGWGGYYLFLILKSSSSKWFKLNIISLPLIVLFLITSSEPVKSVFEKRYMAAVNDIVGYINGDNPYSSLGARFVMYETSWNLIQERPWLGYGADGFKENFKSQSAYVLNSRFSRSSEGLKYSQVHNQFLMTWIQYGIFPVLILLSFFIYILRFFWLGMRSSEPESKPIFIAGIVFSVATFMSFMPESPLEYSSYSAHYWLFLTLLFVFAVIEKNKLIEFKESSHVS
ncbi:O-antigen ligase [Thiomicrorhabdus sp. Kp2]|uniref:O-antigen ligase family protein n=1 Tax=Thiomicrorhabdus sp. Kp2 TaxID=1123518 RepID=UPI0003F80092|nr:O-antigen ligase family protein [Thiomicrorhabdus sp. Kp2]